MVPFAVLPFFTGPIGEWLGGIDISWLAGLLVAAAAYYGFTRRLDQATERRAVGASDAQLEAVAAAPPPHALHRPPLEYGLLEGP